MKKDYNKGLASGIRLSEDIVKNNTDAVDKMTGKLDNLDKDVKDMGDAFGNYMDAKDNAEIQRLLNIITKTSLDDLEDNEKLILANILSSTAMQYGTNDQQKLFLKTFLKAAGVSMEDVLTTGFNGSALAEAVDSLSVIRYMYQILNDFLYLANGSVDFGNTYDTVLSWFGGIVNEAEAKKITMLKVSLYGVDILIEQFTKGFSIGDEDGADGVEGAQASILPADDKTPYKEIYLPCAKEYLNSDAGGYLETKNYLVICPGYFDPALEAIDKETHERKELEEINTKFDKEDLSTLWGKRRICSVNDTLIYIRGNNVVLYDIKNGTETILPDSAISNLELTNIEHLSVCCDNLIYVKKGRSYGDNATYVYSLVDQKEYRLENEKREDVIFTVANDKVYSVSILSEYQDEDDDEPLNYPSLSVFDLSTKNIEEYPDINKPLSTFSVKAISFDEITFIDDKLFFIGGVDEDGSRDFRYHNSYTLFLIDLNNMDYSFEDIKMPDTFEGFDSFRGKRVPLIKNNFILFVEDDYSDFKLCCYDLANIKREKGKINFPKINIPGYPPFSDCFYYIEKREKYPNFHNISEVESGIIFKKYETEKQVKPYDMCGYWVMYSDEDNFYNDKKDKWIFKDIREKWDTEE